MVIAPDLPSPGNELEHRGRGGGRLETDKVDSIDVVGVINCKEMFIFMAVVDVVVVVVVCCCCRFFLRIPGLVMAPSSFYCWSYSVIKRLLFILSGGEICLSCQLLLLLLLLLLLKEKRMRKTESNT